MALLSITPVWGQTTANYRAEDAQLLWAEAIESFNGSLFSYTVYTFPDETSARECSFPAQRCGGVRPTQERFFHLDNEIPLALRESVVVLSADDWSEPLAAPNGKEWRRILVTAVQAAKFPREDMKPIEWLNTFAASALPSVEDLRTRPELQTRRVLNRIFTAAQLSSALSANDLKPGQLDMLLSNGSTLLVRAVYRNDLEFARALLASGASPDRCGRLGCPLTESIYLDANDMVRLLLDHKANANQLGGNPKITPLMAAASVKNKALAQLLLERGADPLIGTTEKFGKAEIPQSPLAYVPVAETAYYEWLASVVEKKLDETGKYKWSAWIEQDKKRTPVTPGAIITLQRAPFRLVTRMNPEAAFRVLASEDLSLPKVLKDSQLRRGMLLGVRVGASNAESKYLSLPTRLAADSEFTSNEWGYTEDINNSNGTRRLPGKGPIEYVHDIEELIVGEAETKMSQYKGTGFAMLMGAIPPLGKGTDYYKPVAITLRFR